MRSRHWRRREGARLVLFTTGAHASYLDHAFRPDDVLLFGRESAGVPEKVHQAADARLVIPMREGLRSLNVAMACAMAVGEALRQDAASVSDLTVRFTPASARACATRARCRRRP